MVFVLSGVCVVYGICNVILSMVCAMCVPHCVVYVWNEVKCGFDVAQTRASLVCCGIECSKCGLMWSRV